TVRPLDLLGGPEPLLDAQRAADLVSKASDVGAIAAIESPVSPGRTAVVITGTAMPRFADFLGYARSRTRAGDLLMVSGAERALFQRVLRWTEQNLAQGDLRTTLPAWHWGKRRDGSWGVVDRNPASDADLWLAFDLLEAGRLWSEPRYTALGQRVLANVAAREV